MMGFPARAASKRAKCDDHHFGVASLFLLWLIGKKRMHGYEIIKTLKDGGFSMATPARIYPLLSGLKHRKFISLIEEKQGKRIRKVYALTALGKTHLRTSKERYFTGVIAEFMKDMLKG